MTKPLKILLTGPPGCGKSTAVIKIAAHLDKIKIAGFYTGEIRTAGVRKGFSWHRLDGPTGTLAHIDIKGKYKVSKYGVDIADFEKSVVPILDSRKSSASLFIIDEIGKMECLSQNFVSAVQELFDSDKSILATIALQGPGLIADLKARHDVKLFILNAANRDAITADVLQILQTKCLL
jgi:nucleoside-triphosphatase